MSSTEFDLWQVVALGPAFGYLRNTGAMRQVDQEFHMRPGAALAISGLAPTSSIPKRTLII
jgi:hypothetical protein